MKFKKIALLGLAVLMTFSLSACTQQGENPPTETVVRKDTHGTLSEEVKKLTHSQADVETIAKTIREGLEKTTIEDADSAVLLYVKYADSKSSELAGEMLYASTEMSDRFYKIFGEHFQNTWKEDLIPTVADQEIKDKFLRLQNSYMKIDAYGEYMGPVVDYKKISELPNLSKEVKTFYQNVSGLYTTGRMANELQGLDYSATAQYAAAMEDTYKEAKDLTLYESAQSMLSFALNLYYTGTDGSSPFDFEKKTLEENFVAATKENNEKYPDYHVGKLGKAFLKLSDDNDGQLSSEFADLVINYKKFGFDSEKAVRSNKVSKDANYFEITPIFSGFGPTVEEKIASEIATAVGQIKESVKWEETENTNYHLSYIVDFANDHYFSLQLSGVSYNQENSTNLYDNISMIFDSKTGERIDLKAIFKDNYEPYMKEIKALVLKDIVETQKLDFKTTKEIVLNDNNVLLDPNYLMVTLKKGSYSDEQQYDVVCYVNYSDLLNTFDMISYLRGEQQ